MLRPNSAFELEYQNGVRATEAYAENFEVDPRFLCFEEDPKFEATARERGGKGRQCLVNFFSPKRDSGDPIPLIYFAIQVTDPKKQEEAQGVENILAAE